ncbi:hypothetical protein ABZ845_30800 [Streptomyces sp. NPDC047022]|uniref:hypothetical protein n=1 Tax=Streptomyces sp. NPDC047022 TaxID=3155737 RepID=UPI0033F3C6DC
MGQLPAEGRRIAMIGKGGSGKSTTLGYLLAHWAADGIPAAALDADEPGEGELGSLYAWSDMVDLGAPVYRAPAASRIGAEAQRLTPPAGLLAVDTGAWERRAGNAHFAVLASVDLAVLTLQPTTMEIERAGSVLAALDQLAAVGVTPPRLVMLLTMVNRAAASALETRRDLEGSGCTILRTEIPRSDARDGYAQAFGQEPRVVPGSPMALLAEELIEECIR